MSDELSSRSLQATVRTPKTIVPIAARVARRRRAGRIGPPPLQVLHKAAPPADECEAGGPEAGDTIATARGCPGVAPQCQRSRPRARRLLLRVARGPRADAGGSRL